VNLVHAHLQVRWQLTVGRHVNGLVRHAFLILKQLLTADFQPGHPSISLRDFDIQSCQLS